MAGSQLMVLVMLVVGSYAGCPEPSVLKNVTTGETVCARLYEDADVLYDRCCGGGYFDIKSPADVPFIERFWNDRASSLVVGPRCELTVWNKRNKRGNRRKFRTGIQYRLEEAGKGLFGNWDNSITSYYCICK
uniref:syncollin-like n=1 Tax=Pristiophorus japonicus TaxID=55135 RepID=UPI00398E4EBA